MISSIVDYRTPPCDFLLKEGAPCPPKEILMRHFPNSFHVRSSLTTFNLNLPSENDHESQQ